MWDIEIKIYCIWGPKIQSLPDRTTHHNEFLVSYTFSVYVNFEYVCLGHKRETLVCVTSFG
jgi:hypothetical protein